MKDMGLFTKFVSMTRKPEGFLGKMLVSGMNGGHAKLADWGMSHAGHGGLVPFNPQKFVKGIERAIKES